MASSMNKSPPRALVVGHVAKDFRGGKELQGGPPLYQIPILISFGFSVDLITSCGTDFFIPHLPGLTVYRIISENTTTFEFVTEHNKQSTFPNFDDRALLLRARAFDLKTPQKLELRSDHYDIIILSGIAQEISFELIEQLSQLNATIFAMDMQTIARSVQLGAVVSTSMDIEKLNKALIYCNLITGTQIELDDPKIIWNKLLGRHQLQILEKTIVRTAGGDPIQAIQGNEYFVFDLEKIPTDQIIDGTGSGDIFISSLAATLLSNADFETSVQTAHQITKEHLFIHGPPSLEQSKTIVDKYT